MKNRLYYPFFDVALRYKEVGEDKVLSPSSLETLFKYINNEAIPKLQTLIIMAQAKSLETIKEIETFKDNSYMERLMAKEIDKLKKRLAVEDEKLDSFKKDLEILKNVDDLKTYDEFLSLPCFRA